MKVDPVHMTVEVLWDAAAICSEVEAQFHAEFKAMSHHDCARECLANAAGAAMCRRAIMRVIEQMGTQKIAE